MKMTEQETAIGDTTQSQMDKELAAWLETLPFSKPAKNLTRDFSDAVLMAEILKLYYPRHVELHNYVPASSLGTKRENWSTLNRKVLAKIDMRLSKETIHHLANASQGAIEKLLSELRTRVLRDEEEARKLRLVKRSNAENADDVEKEEIVSDSSSHEDRSNLTQKSSSRKLDAGGETRRSDPSSGFGRLKRDIFHVFGWIACFFRVWSILKLPRFGKHARAALVDAATEKIETPASDETVPRAVYTDVKRELREKEEIICTLNHKIAYLESSTKLKDLRISSLTAQILQNAVEMDCTAMKSQPYDGTRERTAVFAKPKRIRNP